MTIRASAIKVGSVCIVDPRDGGWKEPPKWMHILACLPWIEEGFISSDGQFINTRDAHLSAFCSGQLKRGSQASGKLTWDMLVW